METGKRWVGTVTVLVALGIVGASVMAWFAWRAAPGQAPEFELESTGYENGTLGDPVAFRLEDYRGRTLVIDFMAVSCASCRVLTETVVRPLQATYGARADFAILSVDVWSGGLGESREDLIGLQRSENTTWRHALDTDGLLLKYRAIGIPYLAIIDPSGRLVYARDGLPSYDDVEQAVLLSMTGQATSQELLNVGIVGLSMLAGLAALVSPCAVGLLPGYVGQLMQAREQEVMGRRSALQAPLRAGVLAAAGATALYALLAILFWLAGPFLRPHLQAVGPWMALAMFLVGAGMVLGFDWTRFAPARQRGSLGQPSHYAGFGFVYALVSFGCAGPVFLPILAGAFLQGPFQGLVAFMAYAASLAAMLVVIASLVNAGRGARTLQRLFAKARPIQVASGVLLAAGAGYLLWFYAQAGQTLL